LTPEAALRYEGVRLFVERAKLVRPDFDLTAERFLRRIDLRSARRHAVGVNWRRRGSSMSVDE
jgi:hypothetical protein